jgi:hypothetical protein
MSEIFNQQQEMMKRIQDFIEQEKEKLNTIYSECITKMNDCNPNKQVYDDIDQLCTNIWNFENIPDYSDDGDTCGDTYDSFDEFNFEKINYWYDMNKRTFINKIEDYNVGAYMCKYYKFYIYLEEQLFHTESVLNKISIPMQSIKMQCVHIAQQNHTQLKTVGKIEEIIKNGVYRSSNCYITIMSKQPNIKIRLYIDNFLNIYIPQIKTIIINNYTKFSKFVLNSQYDRHFNKQPKIILNKNNEYDEIYYDMMDNVIANFNNYLTSQDSRNKFNDGKLFEDILDFLDYDEMILDVKTYLDFASKLRVYGKEDIFRHRY